MFVDSGAISMGEDQGPESDVEEKTLFGLIVGHGGEVVSSSSKLY